LRRERKGKIYNGYFLMFFIMAPISSTLATTAGMSPSSQTASTGTVAQQPASPVQPAPVASMPPGVPAGVQPGVPGMPPEQKKSKWWLWVILALGLIILVGLVAYFMFRSP